VKAISRRKFVATTAAVNAGAVLRTPALAFENQNAGAVSAGSAKPVGHEVVASQAIPFPMKSVRLQPGVFSQAAEGKQPLHRFNRGLGGKKNSPEPADLVPEGTTLIVSAAKPAEVNLKLRIPCWVKNGSVKVNGRPLPAFAVPAATLSYAGRGRTATALN
jgi:hypothetical protein